MDSPQLRGEARLVPAGPSPGKGTVNVPERTGLSFHTSVSLLSNPFWTCSDSIEGGDWGLSYLA